MSGDIYNKVPELGTHAYDRFNCPGDRRRRAINVETVRTAECQLEALSDFIDQRVMTERFMKSAWPELD